MQRRRLPKSTNNTNISITKINKQAHTHTHPHTHTHTHTHTYTSSKVAGMHYVRPPVWLALDRIQVKTNLLYFFYLNGAYLQDPMNFGAILRVAFFLGAERVIATAKNW